MTAFHDCTQVLRPVTRRITSTWMESQGQAVLLVPQTARELAPAVALGARLQSEHALEARAAGAGNTGDMDDALHAWMQLWWLEQWNNPHGQYRVVTLDEEEERLKETLLNAMPERAFGCSRRDILEHADAIMVAQVLAAGGTLLVTNNARSMDHDRLNEWVERESHKFGIRSRTLLVEPDDWLDDALAATTTQPGVTRAKLMLRALWPEELKTPAKDVVNQVRRKLARATGLPFERSCLQADNTLEVATELGLASAWVEEVRREAETATRAAEMRHPARRAGAREL